jgi:hypothetical protein
MTQIRNANVIDGSTNQVRAKTIATIRPHACAHPITPKPTLLDNRDWSQAAYGTSLVAARCAAIAQAHVPPPHPTTMNEPPPRWMPTACDSSQMPNTTRRVPRGADGRTTRSRTNAPRTATQGRDQPHQTRARATREGWGTHEPTGPIQQLILLLPWRQPQLPSLMSHLPLLTRQGHRSMNTEAWLNCPNDGAVYIANKELRGRTEVRLRPSTTE